MSHFTGGGRGLGKVRHFSLLAKFFFRTTPKDFCGFWEKKWFEAQSFHLYMILKSTILEHLVTPVKFARILSTRGVLWRCTDQNFIKQPTSYQARMAGMVENDNTGSQINF